MTDEEGCGERGEAEGVTEGYEAPETWMRERSTGERKLRGEKERRDIKEEWEGEMEVTGEAPIMEEVGALFAGCVVSG